MRERFPETSTVIRRYQQHHVPLHHGSRCTKNHKGVASGVRKRGQATAPARTGTRRTHRTLQIKRPPIVARKREKDRTVRFALAISERGIPDNKNASLGICNHRASSIEFVCSRHQVLLYGEFFAIVIEGGVKHGRTTTGRFGFGGLRPIPGNVHAGV